MLKFWKTFTLLLFIPQLALAAINIVVVAPQEGEYQQYGKELSEGVKIAAAEINANGGILGEQINIITADDRCDDIFAVSMAQMLTIRIQKEDKINLIIGPFCSNKLAEVSHIYHQAQIPQILPLPIRADIRNLPSSTIKLSGITTAQANVFFDYYLRNLNNQNTALVYSPHNYADTEIAAKVQQLFSVNNLSNKLTIYSFANYNKNYDLMAKEILLNNKVIYIIGHEKEVAKLTRELKDRNSEIAIFTERNRLDKKYIQVLGDKQNDNYFLGLKNFKDNPNFAETLVNLRLKGKEISGLGVYGLAALNLWKNAVIKAQSLDGNKISETINTNDFNMPWGKYSDIINQKNNVYKVFRLQDNEYIPMN